MTSTRSAPETTVPRESASAVVCGKRALRSALRKFQLHNEHDLFDKAYAYIRQYYAL